MRLSSSAFQRHPKILITIVLAAFCLILNFAPFSQSFGISAAIAKETPKITNLQQAIINALVLDDYEILTTNSNLEGTKLGELLAQEYKGLQAISARDLCQQYYSNEQEANNKYLGKWLLVYGTFNSIENTSDNYSLNIKGSDRAGYSVNALIKKTLKRQAYPSGLKSGSPIQVICLGGLKGRIPTLHSCEILTEVIAPYQKSYKQLLENAMLVKGNKEVNAMWAFSILKIEQLLMKAGK